MNLEEEVLNLKEKYENIIENMQIIDSYTIRPIGKKYGIDTLISVATKEHSKRIEEAHDKLKEELDGLSEEYRRIMEEYGIKPKEDPIEQLDDLTAILLGIKGVDTSKFWEKYKRFEEEAEAVGSEEYTFYFISEKLSKYAGFIAQLKVEYILDSNKIGGEVSREGISKYVIGKIDELREYEDLILSFADLVSEYSKIMGVESPEEFEEMRRDIEIIDKFKSIKIK